MIDEEKLDRVKKALWAEVNRYVARIKVGEEWKSGFVLDEHNVPVLRDLAHWIIGAPCEWLQPGMGIGICGSVGTFKTEMMNALSRTLARGGGRAFPSFSMLAVEKEYSRSSKDEAQNGGPKVILKYGRMAEDICFNDIGEEPMGQHFGVACDVFGEIMSLRNELYAQRGILTHGTSNIVEEKGLLEKYDKRTTSRTIGQLRWIPLGGPDRRRNSIPVLRNSAELFAPEPPLPTEEEIAASKERALEVLARIKDTLQPAKLAISDMRAFSSEQKAKVDAVKATLPDMSDDELDHLHARYLADEFPSAVKPYLVAIEEEQDARLEAKRKEETTTKTDAQVPA